MASTSLPIIARIRRRLFGLSPRETDFEVRGFPGRGPMRERLEGIGRGFVAGFNLGLEIGSTAELCDALDQLPVELRGFAHEGAGMSLALLDRLWPPWTHRRVAALIERVPQHTYLVHVGVGWALARLRLRPAAPPRELDGLLGWLAFDGYGFHEGYFAWKRWLVERASPRLEGVAARVFDQGLGRSMWFSLGADVKDIAQVMGGFSEARAQDLWSGVGLASAYAGAPSPDELRQLRKAAGVAAGHLAQGACFAATARARAGHVPEHTRAAVEILCGFSADDAAALCDATIPVAEAYTGDDYLAWRAAIRSDCERKMGSWNEDVHSLG